VIVSTLISVSFSFVVNLKTQEHPSLLLKDFKFIIIILIYGSWLVSLESQILSPNYDLAIS